MELADFLPNVYRTTEIKRNYLLVKMLNTSWLKSFQSNQIENLKTPWNYSIVSSLLPQMKTLSKLARTYKKLDIELLS